MIKLNIRVKQIRYLVMGEWISASYNNPHSSIISQNVTVKRFLYQSEDKIPAIGVCIGDR